MDRSTRRVSLRSRKTLKLRTQTVCKECKRSYFPPEPTESDSDSGHDKICNICEEKQSSTQTTQTLANDVKTASMITMRLPRDEQPIKTAKPSLAEKENCTKKFKIDTNSTQSQKNKPVQQKVNNFLNMVVIPSSQLSPNKSKAATEATVQSTRRTSLRSRAGLKLRTQSVCKKCKRNYFPAEAVDSSSESDQEQICNNCEDKEKSSKTSTVLITQPKKMNHSNSSFTDECPALANIPKETSIRKTGTPKTKTNGSLPLKQLIKTEPQTSRIGIMNMVAIHSSLPSSKAEEILTSKALRVMPIDIKKEKSDIPMVAIGQKFQADIEETDSKDTLQEKFPKANPFELEFLMFLRKNKP